MKKSEGPVTKKAGCAGAQDKNVWMLGGGVVFLAVFLCVAMFKTKDSSWTGQRTAPAAAQQVAYRPNCTTGLQPVALARIGVPVPIFRDAVMPHAFRGVCENCHVVNPDIPIPANTTQVLHGYRGVCSNCHTITGI